MLTISSVPAGTPKLSLDRGDDWVTSLAPKNQIVRGYYNCLPLELKVDKGKWSLKLNVLEKGTLYIDARAWDRADNASKWASIKSKITKS